MGLIGLICYVLVAILAFHPVNLLSNNYYIDYHIQLVSQVYGQCPVAVTAVSLAGDDEPDETVYEWEQNRNEVNQALIPVSSYSVTLTS